MSSFASHQRVFEIGEELDALWLKLVGFEVVCCMIHSLIFLFFIFSLSLFSYLPCEVNTWVLLGERK